MICDSCYDREACRLKDVRGQHQETEPCAYYFPDLASAEFRNPIRPSTPEDRRKPFLRREA